MLGAAAVPRWVGDVVLVSSQEVVAIAASVTALTAVFASIFAFIQVRQTAAQRREQSQPYVAVYVERNDASPHFLDLVVRNFGITAARDVQIDITPPLQRTGSASKYEDVQIPSRIRTLVPGQEWRTWWDDMSDRKQLDLPTHHIVRVRYTDSVRRRTIDLDYDIDLQAFEGTMWVNTFGLHQGMRALTEIEKHIRRSREGLGGGFKVFVRDGDRRDSEQRAAHAQRLEKLEGERAGAGESEPTETPGVEQDDTD